MNELLEKILAADVLTEETKAEIANAFNQMVEEKVAAAKADAEVEVRAQLAEQWITERDHLIDALDAQVTELLEAEIAELKQDISAFRDLEVEYAGKLVEAKKELATQLDSDIHALAENLDGFITLKMQSEFDELKESIQEVRQNELGRKVFEMFAREYQTSHVNKSDLEKRVVESTKAVSELKAKLNESEARLEAVNRERKLGDLLSNLSGKQRAVMETILNSVPTEKLEEGYNTFLARVLKESTEKPAKEGEVLAEGKTAADTVVVTGDRPRATQVVQEGAVPTVNPDIEKLRRLAGLSTK